MLNQFIHIDHIVDGGVDESKIDVGIWMHHTGYHECVACVQVMGLFLVSVHRLALVLLDVHKVDLDRPIGKVVRAIRHWAHP